MGPTSTDTFRFDAAMTRQAFVEAGQHFGDLVTTVSSDSARLELPGLGEWTVRDLIGHTTRALLTVTEYLDISADPQSVDVASPLDYLSVLTLGYADPTQIAERGRDAGRALGRDAAASVRVAFDAAIEAMRQAHDDAPVRTPAGVMRLIDYLPSRIFELVVHSDDLARAIGSSSRGPTIPRQVAMVYIAAFAAGHERGPTLLAALLGRQALPSGFSLI